MQPNDGHCRLHRDEPGHRVRPGHWSSASGGIRLVLRTLAPVAALVLSVALLQLEEFSSLEIGVLGSSYFPGISLGCLPAPYATVPAAATAG